jgi:cation diffusion facilitator family transporter
MDSAFKEKNSAAFASVVAAVFITAFKIIVGLLTGSLGIMAEAAHSGLDLVAAFITFLAIRISCRPADQNHHYGHGKAENLSALIETILLLVTCVWIIYEAINRLFFENVHVDASQWAFLVMLISIVLDYSRSRVLYRAAKKYNSQALEADALHFSTDIWSSGVVIFGLAFVKLSSFYPAFKIFESADSIAALIVAVIVIAVSVRLTKRTILALTDAAPDGMAAKIKDEIERMGCVINCHNVRVRYSGADLFIDVHVNLDGTIALEKAHSITEDIESVIQEKYPAADITIHPEPAENTK